MKERKDNMEYILKNKKDKTYEKDNVIDNCHTFPAYGL